MKSVSESTAAGCAAAFDLTLSRDIADVSCDQLFRAWTTRFKEWWGPHGMTTPVCEMDLRPGGVFRTVMRAPDGAEYPTRGVFLEVKPPTRIAFTDAFDPDWQPSPHPFFVAVIDFEALPGGGARYTARARHWTKENRDRHERMGFQRGWGECFDRLADVARSLDVS